MATFFSGDEIIKMAVQTEETGYEFYKLAQKNVSSAKLKDLFDYLAEAEQRHKETYLGLKDAIAEAPQGVPIDWDELGLYIKAMTDSSFFVGDDKNINLTAKTKDEKEAVDFAIGFEKDTLLFFYQILDIVKSADRPVVEKIVQEEKEHIKKLAEIKKTL
jgi:rubrerythrin